MKIVLCEPGKTAKIAEINETLESYQEVVGGLIQAVYPFDDPIALVCNEEGKLKNLDVNRGLYDEKSKLYDILCGTFFICGIGEDNFCSLTDELAEKYRKVFQWPEYFFKVKTGVIRGIKYDPDKNGEPIGWGGHNNY